MPKHPKFNCLVGQSPMSKPSKPKLFACMAGVDRYTCSFTDFGDALISDRDKTVCSVHEGSWLYPELHDSTSPSAKLTSWLQALQPESRVGQKHFSSVAVDCLPPNPTAAGFRPGAINTFATCIPAECAAHNMGHEIREVAALWEYMDANLALLIPGAVVLHGWPPMPYGRMGVGPVPAKLEVLGRLTPSFSVAELEPMIDEVFAFGSHSPPML